MRLENQKVLTINGGSSSIKFAIYDMAEDPVCHFSGTIDRIGLTNPAFTVTDNNSHKKTGPPIQASTFREAAGFLTDWLEKQPDFGQVKCIGHRIVNGMQHTNPETIDNDLLKELNRISEYDPDHLPAEIELIQLFKKKHPGLLQVACFDTAFHTTLPRIAKILPIPRRFDKVGIQRYGFHGLSYTYLMEALRNTAGNDAANGRIILAHLGSGASLAAVKEGKCIDTSMGFTPAGGLMMSTRCGDLDPGVAWYLMQSEGMTPLKFSHLINHESGLLGVSETSSDMQDLLRRENSDSRAAEAVGLFCYNAKKWIGAFSAALGGLDGLVFSGGIGENAPVIRSRICEGLGYAGIELDEEQNNKNAGQISTVRSAVKVRVIPTNEEVVIAKSAASLYVAS